MSWRAGTPVRLLIREPELPTVENGAHRPLRFPGESAVFKLALGDRPRLSGLLCRLYEQIRPAAVCASVAPGSYWLNNRGYAAYLSGVPDALRVHRFLLRAGITNRFQGGFLLGVGERDSAVRTLAAQPFSGGPDVHFSTAAPRLIATACHELDLHFETPQSALAEQIAAMARADGLAVRGALESISL